MNPESETNPSETDADAKTRPAATPPTTRDDDGSDAPPPMISPARGPMDQIVPDVPTGSTPLTRQDD